jgi:hypothetical protein
MASDSQFGQTPPSTFIPVPTTIKGGKVVPVSETKAATFDGPKDQLPEEVALQIVISHLYLVHSLERPEHPDQTEWNT